MPYQQILQKYDYWSNFACRIHICNENSSKSYDFHEKCKKIEKWIILLISVNFLRFSLKLLSRISEKSENMFFRWKRRQIKKKLEIFKFLRKSVLSQVSLISKFYKNLILRVILHAEFISAMKTVQNTTIFMKNAKK